MDGLNAIAAYFNEKERKKLSSKLQESGEAFPEMTEDEIRLSCLENNGYTTPELNEKIYLHFRGFKKIENLDAYTGCKAIWLESNGFSKIENLSHMIELRCLYFSKNLLTNIDGLEGLKNLVILDVSYNRLTSLQNLSCCPNLQTVNASHNSIALVTSIENLKECPSLNTLDLTNNLLENDETFADFFSTVPNLLSLSLNGNNLTKMPNFRKKMILKLPKLGYLDRPIDEQEKFFAAAFGRGGKEEESKARVEWREMKEKERVKEREEYKKWQQEQKALREKMKSEGRSFITEMSAEEIAQRQQEAEQAHDAEQKLLELGVSKVASKYWQMEGADKTDKFGNRIGPDVLDRAIATIHNEAEVEKEKPSVEEGVDTNDITLEVEASDNIGEGLQNTEIEEQTTKTNDEVNQKEERKSTPTPEDGQNNKAEKDEERNSEMVGNDEAVREAARILETDEEEIRAARVAESFAIFKEQMEGNKNSKNEKKVAELPTCTWDNPAPIPNEAEKPLF